jgi:oligopeptide/dipeptide ABC transporter ATP-binding protein
MAAPTSTKDGAILSVRNLRTVFRTDSGLVPAVDGVSFDLGRKEVLGIVGESGSGKSVTALSILRLIPNPPGQITAGEIWFDGRDLLKISEREMQAVRGRAISMIFQEPMTSLNPVFSIGEQIMETLRIHERLPPKAARTRAIEMLARVGIPSPAQRIEEYPHQLSGGMRQRVMIAMALSCNPQLLLADEPTTALDVTIQAQILDLLRDLQRDFNMAVIVITHNMGVVAEFADRVLVMYAGRIVEQAGVHATFEQPMHPYTEGLLNSIPHLELEATRLQAIPGVVPNPFDLPPGCRFAPRCRYMQTTCEQAQPDLLAVGPEHWAACIRHSGFGQPASAGAKR